MAELLQTVPGIIERLGAKGIISKEEAEYGINHLPFKSHAKLVQKYMEKLFK